MTSCLRNRIAIKSDLVLSFSSDQSEIRKSNGLFHLIGIHPPRKTVSWGVLADNCVWWGKHTEIMMSWGVKMPKLIVSRGLGG